MFCSRTINNRIVRLHERALRIAYNDYISTFDELLAKNDSVNTHQQTLKALANEIYKVYHNLSTLFIRDICNEKNIYNNTRSNVYRDK